MLSPNVVTVGANIATGYSEILSVDRFAFAAQNIMVGKLSPDPDWLGPLRTRVATLSGVAQKWQKDRPSIWSEVLLPFVDYYTLFKGFTDTSRSFGNDKAVWIQALQQLQQGLQNGVDRTRLAANSFTGHINDIKDVESLLTQSLDTAWAELSDEEQAMIDLASQVTHLQDQLDDLQDSITQAEISSGKAYFQSSLSISYTLLSTAGADVPYLAILGEVFTIGKMAYDLIVTDKEIDETIDQIVALRIKASQEAQAAAMTKAVIHLVDNLNLSMASMQDQLPPFVDMWAAERDKVADAISALNAGAKPENLIDLVSMPSAAASWKTLADLVPKVTQAAQPGKPVSLTTTRKNQIGV